MFAAEARATFGTWVRRLSALVIAGVVLATARPLLAQGTTDRTLAESLFRQGRELMDRGEIPEACAKLAESYRLDRALGTLLNLALCHEKEGKVSTAWAEFIEAADDARRDTDDRESFARKHVAALETELPRIHLEVHPQALALGSLEIRIDGVVVGRAAWTGSLPVDPGNHHIEAAAPGKQPWAGPFVVAAGPSTQSVAVPALTDVPRPPAEVLPPAAPAATASPRRAIGYIVGGVGIVGVAIGTVFGLRALSLKGERDQECRPGNLCTADGLTKDDDARSAATLSTVGFVAGAALLAGGAVLVLTAPSSPPSPASPASPGPTARTIGVGRVASGGGLVIGGTW